MSRPSDAAKRAQWSASLRDFASSGLGIREFCRRRGLSEPRFYFWRKRLSEPSATLAPANGARLGRRPMFVPMRIVPAASGADRGDRSNVDRQPVRAVHGGRIELLLGGVTVRLRGAVPTERLAEVLAVLDRREARC